MEVHDLATFEEVVKRGDAVPQPTPELSAVEISNWHVAKNQASLSRGFLTAL
jgi:hypothetical protein